MKTFTLGLPYDEDVICEVYDEDGKCVDFNGEEIQQLDNQALYLANHSAAYFGAIWDRRFERDPVHYEELRRVQGYTPAHRDWFDWIRGSPAHRNWFDWIRGWWRKPEPNLNLATQYNESQVDTNPYIPPPATPELVNWDPFAITTPTVKRWGENDLRRHEELERRGYSRAHELPIQTPHEVVEHVTPAGPPPAHRR